MKDYMKILGAVFLLLVVVQNGAWGEEPDFRKVRWGMSKYTVMAEEEIKPEKYFGSSLHYSTTIMGLEMDLIYEFFHNSLVEGTYTFHTPDRQKAEKVKELLVKKYGEPNTEPDTESDVKGKIGGEPGELRWVLDRTIITFSYKSGGSYKDGGKGRVTYTSRSFIENQLRQKELEEQRRQKEEEALKLF